jgi:hypothetical protein
VGEYTTSGEAVLIRFAKPVLLFDETIPVSKLPKDAYTSQRIEATISGDRLEFRWNNAYTMNVPMALVDVIIWENAVKEA